MKKLIVLSLLSVGALVQASEQPTRVQSGKYIKQADGYFRLDCLNSRTGNAVCLNPKYDPVFASEANGYFDESGCFVNERDENGLNKKCTAEKQSGSTLPTCLDYMAKLTQKHYGATKYDWLRQKLVSKNFPQSTVRYSESVAKPK